MANWQHVTLSKHQTNLLFIKMTPFKKPGMGGRRLKYSNEHETWKYCDV